MFFSEKDRMILETYKTIILGLADYLGENSEVVLHSLENLEKSVIMIAGEHTGRKIGAPITDLALNMLKEINCSEKKPYQTYFTKNKNGKKMKSSTIAIYGENNRIIGLLCINLNLDCPFDDFIKDFIYPKEEININQIKNQYLVENFSNDSEHLIEAIIEKISLEIRDNQEITISNKNKEIIKKLYEEGIFNMKDSVFKVAEYLNISKHTVYLHLRNLNKIK